jgi:hypothetical protein
MLAWKVLESSAQQWLGRHPKLIPDADMWRWRACVLAAQKVVSRGG